MGDRREGNEVEGCDKVKYGEPKTVIITSLNKSHFRDLFLAGNFGIGEVFYKAQNKFVVLDELVQHSPDVFLKMIAPIEVAPPTKVDRRKLCERG